MPDLDPFRLRELTWAEWIEVDGRVVDRTEAIGYLLDRLVAVEGELPRLRAQVDSLLNPRPGPGPYATPATRPDDTEADEAINSAENYYEAIWELSEKYDVPLTNNAEQWKAGQFLREMGDFITDFEKVAERWAVAPERARADRAESAIRHALGLLQPPWDGDRYQGAYYALKKCIADD